MHEQAALIDQQIKNQRAAGGASAPAAQPVRYMLSYQYEKGVTTYGATSGTTQPAQAAYGNYGTGQGQGQGYAYPQGQQQQQPQF